MKSKLLGEIVDDCTRLIGEFGFMVRNEDDYFQTQHFDLDTALGGGFEKNKVYLLFIICIFVALLSACTKTGSGNKEY